LGHDAEKCEDVLGQGVRLPLGTANAGRTDPQQERRRFAELADSLADTKRRAATQIEALWRRIEQEMTRGASLDHELRGVRERLAEALRPKLAVQ
jgi:hypothetical protein